MRCRIGTGRRQRDGGKWGEERGRKLSVCAFQEEQLGVIITWYDAAYFDLRGFVSS